MWSKKLVKRIAKHKAFSEEILNYANSILGVGQRFTNVNKLAIEFEKMTQTAIKEQEIREQNDPIFKNKDINENAIPSFIQKLEEKIEQYRKMDNEIKKLQKKETMEKDSSTVYELPKNPIIDKLTQKTPEELEKFEGIEGFEKLIKKINFKKKPVLHKLPNGKFRCYSLEQFVLCYCKLQKEFPDAPPIEPEIIRDYLVSKQNSKSYSDNTIESAINQYKF